VPQTAKINGKCCQPYGRATAVWGAGRQYPYKGEDFSYEIFRKKNCCLGYGL
jgi:conjugal transfer pilus assembly protein TraU